MKTNLKFYTLSAGEIFNELDTSHKGLTNEEGNKRRKKFGKNKLEKGREINLWEILFSQIKNPVVYLLVAAALIAIIVGDIPEGIAIAVVILINTIIGFWMEYQARESMKALKKMDKTTAKVRRNGELTEIDATEIVPGDVIYLEAGMLVSADGRIFDESELAIDESPLTGESVPVNKTTDKIDKKDTPVADRKNMVYKGTAVTNGKGYFVVTATGMKTEIGTISEMVSSAGEEEIPLNRKLGNLTKKLIWVTGGLALLFFIFGWIAGKEIYPLLQTAIAWTIAAIPEGLPIVASIALAKGMLRLAKQNVIVKKLAAVETLGETTIIFTDKTGTLTKNQLTVENIDTPQNHYKAQWKSDRTKVNLTPGQHDDVKKTSIEHFLKISVLCNNAVLNSSDSKSEGDPLEIALLKFVKSFDNEKYNEFKKFKRVDEDPFDSETKAMGTVYKEENKYYYAVKGAAQSVLSGCKYISEKHVQKKITKETKQKWLEKNDELAANGLRVLAYGYKIEENPPKEEGSTEEIMNNLTFIGLIGFIDPPSPDVENAIQTCKEAGIKVVMVTGDHPGTAENIAEQIHMKQDEKSGVIAGTDLKEKDESTLAHSQIFARVDPGQKLDIIKAFKDAGEIVGMTGDGVNDAPALKKADIGIAMGKRGTQVAQEVADMVLKDDAFPSIVKAIRQGRIIFGNIRKFIIYQLSYHLAEILVIASISFSLFYLPLLPLQLLFLNLLSDVFPALALGVGQGKQDIMKNPPKNPQEPILTKNHWGLILLYGVIMTLFVDAAYLFSYYYWDVSKELANNVAFFSLAFAQLWHVFDMRESVEHIFINQVTKNKYIWYALLFCSAALMAAYFIPGLANILSIQAMDLKLWILIGVTSISPIIIIQIIKIIYNKVKS